MKKHKGVFNFIVFYRETIDFKAGYFGRAKRCRINPKIDFSMKQIRYIYKTKWEHRQVLYGLILLQQ